MMPGLVRFSACALLLVGLFLLNGCATPVGVNTVTPREAYQDAYANPLSSGVLSDQVKYVLLRHDLLNKFDKEPALTIATLHQKALQDDRGDILYALAEGSYLYGSQLADSYQEEEKKLAPDYFLLSAIYSFYFVNEERSRGRLNIFDHRARTAVDMYNFGLWQGFATGETEGLALKTAERKLPFGSISISLDTSRFPWKMEEFEKFLPADRYRVRGISVRNRTAGVGLPLIALRKKAEGGLSGGQPVPVTALLKVEGGLPGLGAGTARADLVLFSTQDTSSVDSKGIAIPLESDLTTPLAYNLEGSDVLRSRAVGLPGERAQQGPRWPLHDGALSPRKDPGRLRPWHGQQPGLVGGDVQHPPFRSADQGEIPVLVLRLHQQQGGGGIRG